MNSQEWTTQAGTYRPGDIGIILATDGRLLRAIRIEEDNNEYRWFASDGHAYVDSDLRGVILVGDTDPRPAINTDDGYEADAWAMRVARTRLNCLREAVKFTRTNGVCVLGTTSPEDAQRKRVIDAVIDACEWVLNGTGDDQPEMYPR